MIPCETVIKKIVARSYHMFHYKFIYPILNRRMYTDSSWIQNLVQYFPHNGDYAKYKGGALVRNLQFGSFSLMKIELNLSLSERTSKNKMNKTINKLFARRILGQDSNTLQNTHNPRENNCACDQIFVTRIKCECVHISDHVPVDHDSISSAAKRF